MTLLCAGLCARVCSVYTVPVRVVGQCQACSVDGNGGENHGFGLGHGEVLYCRLLGQDGERVQSHARQVTDHDRSQHGKDTRTRRLDKRTGVGWGGFNTTVFIQSKADEPDLTLMLNYSAKSHTGLNRDADRVLVIETTPVIYAKLTILF